MKHSEKIKKKRSGVETEENKLISLCVNQLNKMSEIEKLMNIRSSIHNLFLRNFYDKDILRSDIKSAMYMTGIPQDLILYALSEDLNGME